MKGGPPPQLWTTESYPFKTDGTAKESSQNGHHRRRNAIPIGDGNSFFLNSVFSHANVGMEKDLL